MVGSEDFLTQAVVAAKASLNASCIDREGNKHNLLDCAIKTNEIKNLADYRASLRGDKLDNLSPENKDNNNVMKIFVVPVVLPNGETVDVIVNQKGQDMACVFKDIEGNTQNFTVTDRMKEEITGNLPEEALEKVISAEAIKEAKEEMVPKTLEEFYEKVEDDELVPDKVSATNKALKASGKEVDESSGRKADAKEKEESEKEVPSEVRDQLSQMCSENDLDITKLKEVRLVDPEELDKRLPSAGIDQKQGPVYCMRFKDAQMQDRVVMIQPGKTPIDERAYDKYMTSYMDTHRNADHEMGKEDEHDSIYYTDLSGNTTICKIEKEPRDLECSKKEILQAEMMELEEETKDILNSDCPEGEKAAKLTEVNNKRLGLFKEFGIQVPSVEEEIQADIEITEDVEKSEAEAGESEPEPESTGYQGKVEEHPLPEHKLPWEE